MKIAFFTESLRNGPGFRFILSILLIYSLSRKERLALPPVLKKVISEKVTLVELSLCFSLLDCKYLILSPQVIENESC